MLAHKLCQSRLQVKPALGDKELWLGEKYTLAVAEVRSTGNTLLLARGVGGVMDAIVTGVLVGVLGTVAMDMLNHIFARLGLVTKIDVQAIGRMSAGWARGRFRYRHPNELVAVSNESLLGYVTHYAIGIGLAIPFVLGWESVAGGALSPMWALVYGIATTVASVFFVYPSLGLGVFGMRSPDGIKAPLSSLANHFFFGVGMAVAVLII